MLIFNLQEPFILLLYLNKTFLLFEIDIHKKSLNISNQDIYILWYITIILLNFHLQS